MNEYYSPMDREITTSSEMRDIDKANMAGIDEIGTTTNPFEHQTNALKARIFHGANRVEFSFFGQQKGNKERPTPETFGKRERSDMRELAEINEVETTTHATVGVSGLSGLDPRSQEFSDDHRKTAIDEVKKAINFAAEATTGGAIVFHTGEAPRSMYSEFRDKNGEVMFERHPDEKEREQFFFADPMTRKIFGVKRNDRMVMPILKKKNGKYVYLKDENGNYIVDDLLKKYDPVHKGRIPVYETDEDGTIKAKVVTFNEWKEKRIQEYKAEGLPVPDIHELAKDFFRQQQINQVSYNINFSRFHKGEYEDLLEQRDKIIKALNFYKELKNKVPKSEWWKFIKQSPSLKYVNDMGFVPPKDVDPVDYLEKQLSYYNRVVTRQTEMDFMGKRQSMEVLDMINRSKKASEFAAEETARSMAELGIYTWQMNERAKKKQGETEFKLKHDLYIAPENIFPEMYGGHPDELKNLVLKGRKEMAKELEKRYGMDKKKAKELAEKHIKATFDIGHINVWRKYFKSKKGETLEERNKRFNKWVLGKTKELLDEGIIGHIHISDNFGFDDEHLAAGDGNAPIKEFVEQAKKLGFDEFIVESGSFNPMTSLPDTWMHFDSPVYRIHVPGFTPDTWTDPSIGPTRIGWNNFYRSYFGRTEGPRYLVGDSAPSEEFKGAPYFTGVGLE